MAKLIPLYFSSLAFVHFLLFLLCTGGFCTVVGLECGGAAMCFLCARRGRGPRRSVLRGTVPQARLISQY